MRTFLRGKVTLLFMTLGLVLAIPAVALADNVQNDVVAGGNDTITAGGSTTVNYRITANNGDGQTGCNAADSSAATVTINAPAQVTATPSSLSFSGCGTDKSVAFSSNTPGDYDITVSVSDSGAGTYNVNPAKFTLHVLNPPPPSDTTPPVITPVVVGTLGENGWYTSNVNVSWTVEDGESTVSSTSGCGPTTISADTTGQTLTCTATSAGGTSNNSVTIKRDATDPNVTASPDGPADHNGWYNQPLTVSFSGTDDTSGIASCDAPVTYSGPDDATASVSGSCTDDAGNTGSGAFAFQYDATPPSIGGAASPAANSHGWNNTDVLVDYTCGDNLSGVASCGPDETLSAEGAGQSSTGTAVDNAGNSATATVSGINIDKTDPNVSLVGGPADGQSYPFGTVPAEPTCSASDGLSGLDGPCQVSGYGTTVGQHTVTASAKDKAGNTDSVSRTYTVDPYTLNGFFQPVDMGIKGNTDLGTSSGTATPNSARAGQTIPLKFEIFQGSTELTDTSAVKTFVQKVTCGTLSGQVDAIETYSSGSTTLRYDTTGGQFIFNWQTPKTAGDCYKVTMTAQDNSFLSAYFTLKK